MIKLAIICMMLASNPLLAQEFLGHPEGSYQQGYEQGYQLSECNGGSYCTPGAAPAAPAPNAGQNTYEGGIYQGIQDQQNDGEFHSNIEHYRNWSDNYDED